MIDRETDAEPRRIGVREFRGNMAEFLRLAQQGRTFLLTSRDVVVAEIRPPSPKTRQSREPGALRGRIRMADDFDMLPADVLTAMEDGPA